MSKLSEFPQSEYEKRYRNLIRLGKKDNIGAFIFTDEINIRYFAGGPLTDIWSCRNDFIILIIPTDLNKEPTLLLNRARYKASESSWIEDRRYWKASVGSVDSNEALNLILKVIREKKIARKKIATEIGISEKLCMPILVLKEIEKKYKNNQLVPTDKYLCSLKKIKSKLEINSIRAACEISSIAFEKGLEFVIEGVSEKDISREVKKKMFELGADSVPFLTVIAGWEGRSIQCDSLATDYRVKNGDIIHIDGGCAVNGYCADMCRTGALGFVKNKKYVDLYEATKGAHREVCLNLKKDVLVKDLCLAGKKYFVDHGYEDYLVFEEGQTGHGIGLSLHESPYLLFDSEEIIKENMILAIEPGLQEKKLWEDSSYYTVIENDYLINSDSYEKLTKSSEDIMII